MMERFTAPTRRALRAATRVVSNSTDFNQNHVYPKAGTFVQSDLNRPLGIDRPVPINVQLNRYKPIKHEIKYGEKVADFQLRSYGSMDLDFFKDFLMRVAFYLKIPARDRPLKTRIERWTVVKSPFVHAKSKENFERRTHRRLITLYDANPAVVEMFISSINRYALEGIGVKANLYNFEDLDVISRMENMKLPLEESSNIDLHATHPEVARAVLEILRDPAFSDEKLKNSEETMGLEEEREGRREEEFEGELEDNRELELGNQMETTMEESEIRASAEINASDAEVDVKINASEIKVEEPGMNIEEVEIKAEESEIKVEEPESSIEESKVEAEPKTEVELKIKAEEPSAEVVEPKTEIEEPKAQVEEPTTQVEQSKAQVEEPKKQVEEAKAELEQSKAESTVNAEEVEAEPAQPEMETTESNKTEDSTEKPQEPDLKTDKVENEEKKPKKRGRKSKKSQENSEETIELNEKLEQKTETPEETIDEVEKETKTRKPRSKKTDDTVE